MGYWYRNAARAVEAAAAGVLACAVAFAATSMASGLLAMILAPAAFILAYAALGQVDADRPHAIADFELQAINPAPAARETGDDRVVRLFDPRQLAIARPSAAGPRVQEDAGQALSDALAQLKRSLR